MICCQQATSFKVTDWVKPGDKSGEFKRQASSFRDWISKEPGAKFPVEKGRYHLYISYACPWVCCCVLFFLSISLSLSWSLSVTNECALPG